MSHGIICIPGGTDKSRGEIRAGLLPFADMNASPQADVKYRKLVLRARTLVVLALTGATVALLVQVFAESASQWAAFTVAAGALTAAATLAHAHLNLEGDGFEQFIRDVIGVRA